MHAQGRRGNVREVGGWGRCDASDAGGGGMGKEDGQAGWLLAPRWLSAC